MNLIEINGCKFKTDRDKSYFLKKRSARLDKKLYTGSKLTLLVTIKIILNKDYFNEISIKRKNEGFYDLSDAILSLSYFDNFSRLNRNQYLGFMSETEPKNGDYVLISTYWEILSPTKNKHEENFNDIIKKVSDMVGIDNIIKLKDKDSFLSEVKKDPRGCLGYSPIPQFALD